MRKRGAGQFHTQPTHDLVPLVGVGSQPFGRKVESLSLAKSEPIRGIPNGHYFDRVSTLRSYYW